MTTHADKTPARLRLHDDRGLLHDEAACLPLRSRHGRCSACAAACPVGALAVTVDAVTLSDACTGCGRCTAACPTQALALPEVDALLSRWAAAPPVGAPRPHAATVRIECRMVPPERLLPGSAVLPCLGALTPGMLLAQTAAGAAVDVVDRGWCAGCPTGGAAAAGPADDGTHAAERAVPGGAAHPAAASVAATVLWLQAIAAGSGAAAPPPVVLRREPLPATMRPAALPPAPAPAEPLDRRRFFRAALAKPAGRDRPLATPIGGDGRAAYPADARQPSPERTRQLAALQALADQQGSAVPTEFFPRLHAAPQCCDRRMCVALCPTAALTVADDAGCCVLRFDASRCIACGTCVRACPEAALSLWPHGGTAESQTLATHRRARCADCGDVFTPATATDVAAAAGDAAAVRCPACTKSRRFMADARRQLFGALN